MDLAQLLRHFIHDPSTIALAVLVGLDLVLGICAAVYTKTFKLVYIGDFLRTDVLGKLVPVYAVWAAVHLVGDFDLGSFGVIEETTGALAIAAVGASVLGSIKQLGLHRLPNTIASPDPTTPT